MAQPNILFLMTDQQRFDTIRALGNSHIYTPHLDRLVRRGLSFVNAYSTCPVCVPARYTVRTGCEPPTTRTFTNGRLRPAPGQAETMPGRCGPYLAHTLRARGYRTFGIGKFHSSPWDEDLGYDVHLHSEELYGTPDQRRRDAFAAWIAKEHPQFDYIEALMGERTEMYYMPQVSPLPAALTVESWAADRAVEQIRATDNRPFFGFRLVCRAAPAVRPAAAVRRGTTARFPTSTTASAASWTPSSSAPTRPTRSSVSSPTTATISATTTPGRRRVFSTPPAVFPFS